MEFYKVAWTVVGKNLVMAVQSFFLFSFMPQSMNATLLSLVPKTASAEKMSDFRPIACCNVVYKVISKIMAHHLKGLLLKAIEVNQCEFVQGRLLLENVLLVTELWSFIEAVLRAMRIPDLFVTWIMNCISTAAFSISVNGELKAMIDISIGYHPMCSGIGLSHLSFADDIVVFTDGSPGSLKGTLDVFQDFAQMSGLCINVAKSSVFAAGRGKQALEIEATECGLTVSALPIKYLGLPLTTKTMTRNDYEPLIAKIRARFLSCTSKTLSFAGRLQLINSVIASITNFWCSAFRLPQSFIDEIESMCSAFLWSGSPNITSKSKVAWEEVCKMKQEGGLGVQKIKDVSEQVILRGDFFWDAREGGMGSWIWKKLLHLRPIAKQFLRMEIHSGTSVGLWTDLWHPIGRLIEVIGSLLRPAPSADWAEIMARILSTVHDRLTFILLRLAFQVTIYYICRFSQTRYHEKRGFEGLMQRWFSAHIG
ncbi:hypothetical protein Bca4012_064863 [Brassica carinata]